jgi:transposase-like protein
MLHRIREAMKTDALVATMSGVIVADETWIGGDPANRHKSRVNGPVRVKSTAHNKKTDKQAVVSLINAHTGEVRSRVVPNVSGPTLRKVMSEHLDIAGSILFSDGWTGYKSFGSEFLLHESVDHAEGEYVRGDVSTNKAENFFSQLKRSLDGTHHHVSVEHLPRYLAEFDYRFSTRKLSDAHRMTRLMGQVGGRRMTYRRVAGS